MIIGFCGKARSGKTTAANSFREGVVLSFAGPLKAMLLSLIGQFYDYSRAREMIKDKSTIIPKIGLTPRELMQSLGTEWGRKLVRDDLWIKAAEARTLSYTQNGVSVIFDDIRFQNEVDMLRSLGGKVWRIHRPSLVSEDQHESENQELTGIYGTIVNDGSIEDLQAKVNQINNTQHE